MKTKSAGKPTKAQKPYQDAKRPRKRTAQAPKPKERPLPPALAPSAPAPGVVPFRNLCEERVRELYPGLEPRNDFDLIQLASEHYKGTHAEVFAALDVNLAETSEDLGYEFMMEKSTECLDAFVEPTGVKPGQSAYVEDKFVFVRPIPDCEYSLRLFPGSLSAAEYCLDFVDSATGKPVNSPFDYELWSVPDPDAPWLSMSITGKLRSIERGHGIKQEDILLGEEKFVLRDGQTCVLMRPGKQPVRFTVPLRRVETTDVVEDVYVIDLPKVVGP